MTDIPTITQEEAVEVRAGLAAIVVRHTKIGGYPDTHAIAADAFELGRALSPNMDHAVGGVDPDLGAIESCHVCKHGVRWPHACQPCDEASWQNSRSGRSIVPPPVNQDAVREALGRIANGEAFRCQRFAEDDDAEYFLRAQRGVVELARAALATPPLDNTGLDAATVEPVRSTILEAAEALTREDWQIATTCGDMIDRLPCARCGAKSIKLCRSGLSIDKIDAARDFVNGYGWAAARKRALASGDRP